MSPLRFWCESKPTRPHFRRLRRKGPGARSAKLLGGEPLEYRRVLSAATVASIGLAEAQVIGDVATATEARFDVVLTPQDGSFALAGYNVALSVSPEGNATLLQAEQGQSPQAFPGQTPQASVVDGRLEVADVFQGFGDDVTVDAPVTLFAAVLQFPAGSFGEVSVQVDLALLFDGQAESVGEVEQQETVIQVVPPTPHIASATATSSGAMLQLSFDPDLDALNLYGEAGQSLEPDVTLTGTAGDPIAGSLVWDPTQLSLEFLATGGPLVPDDYVLSVPARADGLVASDGEMLDGNRDGFVGDDFEFLFSVEDPSVPVLSLPDFARGPGQAVELDGSNGIPLTIDNGADVQSVDVALVFDPDLLTMDLAEVELASDLPDDWQIESSNQPSPGRIELRLSGDTALSAGRHSLVVFPADTPSDAPADAMQVLRLDGAQVNDSVTPITDAAVHVLAFPGDVSGSGDFSGFDAALIARVAVGLDTGFADYPLSDPTIIGDVTGNGTISALDASWVARKAVGLTETGIPDLPASAPPSPAPNAVEQPENSDSTEVQNTSAFVPAQEEKLAATETRERVFAKYCAATNTQGAQASASERADLTNSSTSLDEELFDLITASHF